MELKVEHKISAQTAKKLTENVNKLRPKLNPIYWYSFILRKLLILS